MVVYVPAPWLSKTPASKLIVQLLAAGVSGREQKLEMPGVEIEGRNDQLMESSGV